MNITDALVPMFKGEEPVDIAVERAARLFMQQFALHTFVCPQCGKTIYPKVTTNERGIFIESSRVDIRSGLGDKLQRTVCEQCAERIGGK